MRLLLLCTLAVACGLAVSPDKGNAVSGSEYIATLVGDGSAAYAGDGGAATAASLNQPVGLAIDSSGSLLVADKSNHVVRRIIPGADGVFNLGADEIITTVVGTGTSGYSGDGGAGAAATLNQPFHLALDSLGNLYISDTWNHRVRMVVPGVDGIVDGDPDETIRTVAGNGVEGFSGDSGPATSAKLNEPYGVLVDASGTLYVADHDNYRVRAVFPGADGFVDGDADEIIMTVAGTGAAGASGDGGPATSAQVNLPHQLALDSFHSLLIADHSNHKVRRVSPGADGVVDGDADETITTVAGDGSAAYSGDGGPATQAGLYYTCGVMTDLSRNMYVSAGSDRVRIVVPGADGVVDGDSDEIINTVAGNGTEGFSGDGGLAVSASLHDPCGMALDSLGNMYFIDNGNHRVRQVGPQATPFTPTPTDTPTPTETPTPAPTRTPMPTATATARPTFSPTPTVTPTPTKPLGVGGTVLLPPGAVAAEAGAESNDSGLGSATYEALAVVLGGAALGVGAWHTRRRQR